MQKFLEGGWDVRKATLVNELSHSSWTLSCVVGVFIGDALGIPLAIASFAMTSIFICLLCMQKVNATNLIAIFSAVLGVYLCKLVGLGGPAILLGALLGMGCGYAHYALTKGRKDAVNDGGGA
jgi:predicted branched-subunit amino acid permease